jgi:type II secretory pathway component GspD/PulD (secretin)
VRDETQRPFVLGIQYIKGELATVAQPEIVVLSEGVQLEIQPWVVDANAIELSCQLTMSQIDGVSEVKLPGKDIVVQNPRQSRRTISTSCQLARGKTLLIAPHAAKKPDDESGFTYYAITPDWFPDTVAERTAR